MHGPSTYCVVCKVWMVWGPVQSGRRGGFCPQCNGEAYAFAGYMYGKKLLAEIEANEKFLAFVQGREPGVTYEEHIRKNPPITEE